MPYTNPEGQFQQFCYGQAVPTIPGAILEVRVVYRTFFDSLIQKMIKSGLHAF